MPHLTLKQGDTVPDFVAAPDDLAELERELTGDESIRFYMEHDGSGDLIVNQPVTEVRESQPEIVYDFSAGETSRAETHYAEIVVTYADGDVETVRDDGYFEVEITEPTNRDVPPADLDAPDITVGVVDASEVQAPTLSAVETLTGSLTGGQTISSLVGDNLDVEDGVLTATDTNTDTTRSDEEIEDVVGALLTATGAASVTYDDQDDTLTIGATDTDTQLTDGEVEDIVGAFVTAGSNVSVDYDDSAGTLTISATDTDTQLDPGHTNPTYDSDENGTIDADVDNTNTTTTDLSVANVGGKYYASADTSIPSGVTTVTPVALDTAITDDQGELDAANNQVVVTDAGDYFISGTLYWASDSGWSTGDASQANITINGTRIDSGQKRKVGTKAERAAAPPTHAELAAGDAVQLTATQDSGASKTVVGRDGLSFLSVVQIG